MDFDKNIHSSGISGQVGNYDNLITNEIKSTNIQIGNTNYDILKKNNIIQVTDIQKTIEYPKGGLNIKICYDKNDFKISEIIQDINIPNGYDGSTVLNSSIREGRIIVYNPSINDFSSTSKIVTTNEEVNITTNKTNIIGLSNINSLRIIIGSINNNQKINTINTNSLLDINNLNGTLNCNNVLIQDIKIDNKINTENIKIISNIININNLTTNSQEIKINELGGNSYFNSNNLLVNSNNINTNNITLNKNSEINSNLTETNNTNIQQIITTINSSSIFDNLNINTKTIEINCKEINSSNDISFSNSLININSNIIFPPNIDMKQINFIIGNIININNEINFKMPIIITCNNNCNFSSLNNTFNNIKINSTNFLIDGSLSTLNNTTINTNDIYINDQKGYITFIGSGEINISGSINKFNNNTNINNLLINGNIFNSNNTKINSTTNINNDIEIFNNCNTNSLIIKTNNGNIDYYKNTKNDTSIINGTFNLTTTFDYSENVKIENSLVEGKNIYFGNTNFNGNNTFKDLTIDTKSIDIKYQTLTTQLTLDSSNTYFNTTSNITNTIFSNLKINNNIQNNITNSNDFNEILSATISNTITTIPYIKSLSGTIYMDNKNNINFNKDLYLTKLNNQSTQYVLTIDAMKKIYKTLVPQSIGLDDRYGDGSDGDFKLTRNYVLLNDVYYNNLDLNGYVLFTNGYRIFVRNNLYFNNGTIQNCITRGSRSNGICPSYYDKNGIERFEYEFYVQENSSFYGGGFPGYAITSDILLYPDIATRYFGYFGNTILNGYRSSPTLYNYALSPNNFAGGYFDVKFQPAYVGDLNKDKITRNIVNPNKFTNNNIYNNTPIKLSSGVGGTSSNVITIGSQQIPIQTWISTNPSPLLGTVGGIAGGTIVICARNMVDNGKIYAYGGDGILFSTFSFIASNARDGVQGGGGGLIILRTDTANPQYQYDVSGGKFVKLDQDGFYVITAGNSQSGLLLRID